jgi:hypothetical protein
MSGLSQFVESQFTVLSAALPDQDQAERHRRGAISRPCELVDHEARSGPGDGTGALTDPQQADCEQEQAANQ